MKITSNVYEVGGSNLSHPSDASVFLITSGGEAALVDAGTGKGTNRIVKNLQMLKVQPESVRYLFLTHCHYDHTGGAAKIRELTGAHTIAHDLDADFIESGDPDVTAASWYGDFMEPSKIDIRVEEHHRSFRVGDLDIDFYHTPGHSPGSSVLTLRSDGLLVLFGQDVHGPLNDMLRSSRSDYVKSLEFMMSLEADVLCEGHFGVFKGKDVVRDYIESYL